MRSNEREHASTSFAWYSGTPAVSKETLLGTGWMNWWHPFWTSSLSYFRRSTIEDQALIIRVLGSSGLDRFEAVVVRMRWTAPHLLFPWSLLGPWLRWGPPDIPPQVLGHLEPLPQLESQLPVSAMIACHGA